MKDLLLTKIRDLENRFTGLPIRVEYIDGIEWKLRRKISYRMQGGEVSTVRKGFVFDFASIPRYLFWLYPPAGDGKNFYGIAAAWHDWLYVHRKIGGRPIERKEADELFLEIMRYIGVNGFTARAMYRAVRLFGWVPWRKGYKSTRIAEKRTREQSNNRTIE